MGYGLALLGFLSPALAPAEPSGGEIDWIRQFGSPTSLWGDFAEAVAADGDDVFVAGYTYGALPGQISSGSADAYVRKYDAAGNELWTRHRLGQLGRRSGSCRRWQRDLRRRAYVGHPAGPDRLWRERVRA
jgi:hypothetical protein